MGTWSPLSAAWDAVSVCLDNLSDLLVSTAHGHPFLLPIFPLLGQQLNGEELARLYPSSWAIKCIPIRRGPVILDRKRIPECTSTWQSQHGICGWDKGCFAKGVPAAFMLWNISRWLKVKDKKGGTPRNSRYPPTYKF